MASNWLKYVDQNTVTESTWLNQIDPWQSSLNASSGTTEIVPFNNMVILLIWSYWCSLHFWTVQSKHENGQTHTHTPQIPRITRLSIWRLVNLASSATSKNGDHDNSMINVVYSTVSIRHEGARTEIDIIAYRTFTTGYVNGNVAFLLLRLLFGARWMMFFGHWQKLASISLVCLSFIAFHLLFSFQSKCDVIRFVRPVPKTSYSYSKQRKKNINGTIG